MKVRHWSGYGFVNVKKVNKVVGDGGITTLVVDIKGQHEQGLIRDTWDDYADGSRADPEAFYA